MHPPDLEADRRLARVLQEATQLLVAFLEAGPRPAQRLELQLVDSISELHQLSMQAGGFPAGIKAACEFFEWAARCMVAVTDPKQLEDDDYGR